METLIYTPGLGPTETLETLIYTVAREPLETAERSQFPEETPLVVLRETSNYKLTLAEKLFLLVMAESSLMTQMILITRSQLLET